MTFNSDQPREADGKFGEKTGTAPDLTLSEFPDGFPTDSTVAEQVAWALRNDAELTVKTRHGEFTESGLDLAREWNEMPLGAVPVVTAAQLPEPDPDFPVGFPKTGSTQQKVDWALENKASLDIVINEDDLPTALSGENLRKTWDMAQRFHVDFNVVGAHTLPTLSDEVNSVADKLRIESLDETGVTLNDIYALRSAADRAEYRLTEYDAEAFLADKHPEARGLIVAFDSYSGEPYIAGVEVDDADPSSSRNYGTIKPLTGEYEDINGWANNFGSSLSRFEHDSAFDEYGTVLIDDNSAYGEFTDVEGDLEVGESRVYRFAERTV